MNKCNSCGAMLPIDIKSTNDVKKICERCFRITHYNEYKESNLVNDQIVPLLEKLNKKENLIVLVVDILSLTDNIEPLLKIFDKNIILVINKFDVLPKSIKEATILNNSVGNYSDKIVVSSKNGYNIEKLYQKLIKTKSDIYFVGYTNSGKSTLINRLIIEYNREMNHLTTSNMPSTTLGINKVEIDKKLVINDTPGLIDEKSITNFLNSENLKKLIIKKRIKPLTFQLEKEDILEIGFGIYIEAKERANLTTYIPNGVNPFKNKTPQLDNLKEIEIRANETDLIIPGLGFITIKRPSTINIYTKDNIDIIKRKSIFR